MSVSQSAAGAVDVDLARLFGSLVSRGRRWLFIALVVTGMEMMLGFMEKKK